MLKSKLLKVWSIILTCGLLATSFSLFIALTHSAFADGSETVIAHSQLRRVVDPSPRSAIGSVIETIQPNGTETFQVKVMHLGEDNFSIFFYEEPFYTTNYVAGLDLPPLDRTSVSQGSWSRTLIGKNESPADFLPFFGNLTDLNDDEIDISQPGIPQVTTMATNIIGGITNISMGVTNIFGSSTNIINGIGIPNPGQTGLVFSVLWAPLYDLTAKPSTLNYHRHGELLPINDASPNALATVNISFTGNTGRSQLLVHAMHLTPGQQYTLFVSNTTTNGGDYIMIPVDVMTQVNLGSTATLVRDTQFGDPLPQQARDIGDLSGRLIQIRDAFDYIHLQGLMP